MVVFVAVQISACSGREYYDTPPFVPVAMKPVNAATLTNGIPVKFIWQVSDTAERYDFHIFNGATRDIQRYFRRDLLATRVCAGGLCEISMTLSLPVDDGHAWRVRAFNSAGYSDWSRTVFTVAK